MQTARFFLKLKRRSKFAFGHDDLQPVSETFNDELNGFGASIVDAMDTALIMGLDVSAQLRYNVEGC